MAVMQNALAMPVVAPPDFFSILRKLFHSIRDLIERINAEKAAKKQRAEQITHLLDTIKPLIENSSIIERVIIQKSTHANITQIQLFMDYIMRDIQSMLIALSLSKNKLPSSIYKRLKNYIHVLRKLTNSIDRKLIERNDLTPGMEIPIYNIGPYTLLTPLRIFVEDDDSGKYVSCLELPQLYGFGETKKEALEMLDREILSLREDVKASDSISEEFIMASQLLEAAISHHG